MNPKKIGIVVNDLTQGGVSQFLLNYFRQLDYSGFEYKLIVLGGEKDPFIEKSMMQLGIEIVNHQLPYYAETNVIDQFINRFKTAFKAKKHSDFKTLVQSLKLDLLFAHCHIQFLPYLKETRLPVLFVAHSLISVKPKNPINFLLQTKCYAFYLKNTTVITVSESVTNFFHEFRLVDQLVNLFYHPNKTQIPAQQIEYRDKVSRVIYVARISSVKNHPELLKAWKILDQKDVLLQLVGPNDLDAEHQSELESNTPENVHFLGSRSDIPELLLQADLAVFPSKSEGLPLALLEKMAYGLPVITSNIPQLTTIITDNHNGMVYSLGNPEELANKLRILISDFEKRSKLGNAARKTVLDSFAYAPGEPLIAYEKKIHELF